MKTILRVLGVCMLIFGLSDAGTSDSNACPACPAPGTKTVTSEKTVYSETTCYVTTTKTVPTTVYSEKTVPTTVYSEKTVTSTEKFTTTVYSEKTVYVTTQQNVPTTVYNQVPTTVVSTAYQTVPTTVTSILTQPVTVYVTTTVFATVVNSQTIVNTQVVVNTQTISDTVTNQNTQYLTSAVTQVQYSTVTVTNVVPTTIVAPCTTTPTSLSGLVLCTTRDVNPTYTPASPVPSNYLFGCPPGYVCQPKQENCNFERGLPANTYFCSPERCVKSPPLPPLDQFLAYVNRGPTCAWLPPIQGYFNVNPLPWGLSYAIFDIFGQPTCPAVSTSSSSTSSTWATWSSPTPKSSSTQWEGWDSSSPQPSPVQSLSSKITPRAVLAKRAVLFPDGCYQECDYAVAAYQSVGIDSGPLCDANGGFIAALAQLNACSSISSGMGNLVGDTNLDSAQAICTGGAVKRAVEVTQAAPLVITTAVGEAALVTSSSNSTLSKPTASSQGGSAARISGGNTSFMAMLFSLLGLLFGI